VLLEPCKEMVRGCSLFSRDVDGDMKRAGTASVGLHVKKRVAMNEGGGAFKCVEDRADSCVAGLLLKKGSQY